MRILLVALFTVLIPLTAAADRVDDAVARLRSPSFKIRAQAALVLGRMKGQARVVKSLISALKDRHRAVRAAAAIALGKVGNPSSLSALSDAVMDDDMRVAQMASIATARVVQSFVRDRGRFKDNRYNFTIAGWVSLSESDRGHLGPLKDGIMRQLIKHDNVIVGRVAMGKDDDQPDVQLDLSGKLLAISERHCTLEMTLALRPGGYVVSQWKKVTAKGQSKLDSLDNAANRGVNRVLAYLGAR